MAKPWDDHCLYMSLEKNGTQMEERVYEKD